MEPNQMTQATDLLRRARNHMAERETYEEAITTDDMIAMIDKFLSELPVEVKQPQLPKP